MGQVLAYPARCLDKIDGVIIVFIDTGCHSKDIWVENDIRWIETHLIDQ